MGTNRPTFEEKAVAEVRELIEAEPGLSRTAFSRRVCEHFGWRAPNGTLREMGCRVALSKLEWKVLCARYTGEMPLEPPNLRQAVIWLGRLGGYMARPKDYLPGVVTIWRGLITLLSMVEGWRLAMAVAMPNAL